jgi:quinolinate synthase
VVRENTDLIKKIEVLKERREAIILAHNYQIGEVQDIADFVGDSLGLSQAAASTSAKVIVFCGVHFMAETAAILSPKKIVLLPDLNAGCPMADMVSAERLREKKKELPGATIVTYVNSTAEVKAESDYCCTSANAVKLIKSLKADKILFLPDKYLGHYVATKVPNHIEFWNGFCPTHCKILPEDIIEQKKSHPKAKVVVHPECRPEVINMADAVESTTGICRFVKESKAKEFIIGTEIGILHRLRKENPGKKFYPATDLAICPNMKLINLEKILWALEDMENRITVPEEIAIRARKAIDRMLAIV